MVGSEVGLEDMVGSRVEVGTGLGGDRVGWGDIVYHGVGLLCQHQKHACQVYGIAYL